MFPTRRPFLVTLPSLPAPPQHSHECSSILNPCNDDREVLRPAKRRPRSRESSIPILHLPNRRHQLLAHPTATIIRNSPRRTTPTTTLRRLKGSRPDIPESVRSSWYGSEECNEIWRLVQDERDCIEGSRLVDQRDQSFRIEREGWCWVP